jgi:hypothetical protein
MIAEPEGNGFLIDLDFAIICDADREPRSLHRTGTLPFMSIRLLKSDKSNEGWRHGYRDDMESFFYVLIWICCLWEKPKKKKEVTPLKAWMEGSFVNIAANKLLAMIDDDYFENSILSHFSKYFTFLRTLAREFRQLLFPSASIDDLSACIRYQDILKVFDKAIGSLSSGQGAIEAITDDMKRL